MTTWSHYINVVLYWNVSLINMSYLTIWVEPHHFSSFRYNANTSCAKNTWKNLVTKCSRVGSFCCRIYCVYIVSVCFSLQLLCPRFTVISFFFNISFNCRLTSASALEVAKNSNVNKPAESHQRLEMLQSANLILQKWLLVVYIKETCLKKENFCKSTRCVICLQALNSRIQVERGWSSHRGTCLFVYNLFFLSFLSFHMLPPSIRRPSGYGE